MVQKVGMTGCKKHYRIKSGIYFVPVSPEFFNDHLDGVMSTIHPTLCDKCIRELEYEAEGKTLARAATESK